MASDCGCYSSGKDEDNSDDDDDDDGDDDDDADDADGSGDGSSDTSAAANFLKAAYHPRNHCQKTRHGYNLRTQTDTNMYTISKPRSTAQQTATTRPESASSAALWERCPSLPPRDHIMRDSARGRMHHMICGSTEFQLPIAFRQRIRFDAVASLLECFLGVVGPWECPRKVQPSCSRFAQGGSSLPCRQLRLLLNPRFGGHGSQENSACVRAIHQTSQPRCASTVDCGVLRRWSLESAS